MKTLKTKKPTMANNVLVYKRRLKNRMDEYTEKLRQPDIDSETKMKLIYKCEEIAWMIKEFSSLFEDK